jgi:membrane associated rhomboid family serine protease
VSDPDAVRTTRTQSEARELALVLAAAGIEHQVTGQRGEWRLLVAPDDAAAAAVALEAYERERALAVAGPEQPFESYAGFHLAAALWAFYVVTGPAWRGSTWATAGAADAGRLLHGEPWRAVTALTLHADASHLLGNVVSCAVFVTALARLVGAGVAGFTVLGAGTVGNVLAAALRGEGVSVGASTAIFGAIGILGGLEFGRQRGHRRAWLPIAGSLALLAFLGTSPRSDLVAHLFGLLAGLVLGVVLAFVPTPRGPLAQLALGGAALATVAGSWVLAFAHP